MGPLPKYLAQQRGPQLDSIQVRALQQLDPHAVYWLLRDRELSFMQAARAMATEPGSEWSIPSR